MKFDLRFPKPHACFGWGFHFVGVRMGIIDLIMVDIDHCTHIVVAAEGVVAGIPQ